MSKPTMPIANRPNLTHREKRQFELLAQQPELDRAYYDADKNYVIEFSAADDQKNRYAVIEDYFRQSGFLVSAIPRNSMRTTLSKKAW